MYSWNQQQGNKRGQLMSWEINRLRLPAQCRKGYFVEKPNR